MSLSFDFSVFKISSIIVNETFDIIIFEYYNQEFFIDMKIAKDWDIIFNNFYFHLNNDDNDLIWEYLWNNWDKWIIIIFLSEIEEIIDDYYIISSNYDNKIILKEKCNFRYKIMIK